MFLQEIWTDEQYYNKYYNATLCSGNTNLPEELNDLEGSWMCVDWKDNPKETFTLQGVSGQGDKTN